MVAGLLFISLAIMQMNTHTYILGPESYSRAFGIVIIVLAGLSILGIGGRVPALGLSTIAVIAIATSMATPPPVSTDTMLHLQLIYVYGAIAAILVIFGPGHLTIPHLIGHILRQ